MSASSKKKLRKEQNAALLTEKQQKEQAEAKKLRISSTIFIIIMVAVLITAVTVMAVSGIRGSGILQRNTVALTVGEHEIDSVQLNYYFTDMVNSTYQEWSSAYGDYTSYYLSMMGLDVTKPLDEQPYYEDDTITWADSLLDQAIHQATADYTLYDMAIAEGIDPASVADEVEGNVSMMKMYASLSGQEVGNYLKMFYGSGASEESIREYLTVSAVAANYYTAHRDSLTYDDAAIRAHEAEVGAENYTAYTCSTYYVSRSNYLGDVAAEDATDAQLADALAAAEADANSLLTATTKEELDAAIAALAVNEGAAAQSTYYENTLYSNLMDVTREWLADGSRVAGDITVLPYENTVTDENGQTSQEIYGYYVVMFHSANDNTAPMGNVRHLLVSFEGGTADENGNMVYTDAEKAAAKEEAESLLATWKNGEATEDSFIDLLVENSDDAVDNEGLYEDINPSSQYVENFLNWSIDPERVAGETGIVETEYGYHIMYYVGDDELSYRDYMIAEELRAADMTAWEEDFTASAQVVEGNVKWVDTSRAMAANSY